MKRIGAAREAYRFTWILEGMPAVRTKVKPLGREEHEPCGSQGETPDSILQFGQLVTSKLISNDVVTPKSFMYISSLLQESLSA